MDKAADVYLLQNKMNPFPVAAHIQLSGGRLSCRLREWAADAATGWLEKAIDDPELKAKAKAGEEVTVFDLDLKGLDIAWPKQFAGSAMQIPAGDRTWLVSLVYPTGTIAAVRMVANRKESKAWRAAIAEATSS